MPSGFVAALPVDLPPDFADDFELGFSVEDFSLDLLSERLERRDDFPVLSSVLLDDRVLSRLSVLLEPLPECLREPFSGASSWAFDSADALPCEERLLRDDLPPGADLLLSEELVLSSEEREAVLAAPR